MSLRHHLPDVTLCCVDTRHPDQAWWAIQRCTASFAFGQSLFFCPEGWSPPASETADEVSLVPTPALRSINDYNRFMLRDLRQHVRTSHVLVMQWDGFVIAPNRWEARFLEWDYIGAPWYHGNSTGTVGNGGFSLRSRKLLDALAAMNHTDQEPEDMAICVTLRPELESRFGIRFAPLDVAQRFACEYGPYRAAFGFHGMHNFAHLLSANDLRAWLDVAPPEILQSKPARKLAKTLMQNGRTSEAIDLLNRRIYQKGVNVDDLILLLRALPRLVRDSVK